MNSDMAMEVIYDLNKTIKELEVENQELRNDRDFFMLRCMELEKEADKAKKGKK